MTWGATMCTTHKLVKLRKIAPMWRLATVGMMFAALITAHPAAAQTTLVLGYGPGSSSDLVARTLAAEMGAAGDTVVIQNLPGGAQATALAVAQSVDTRRDGRTIYIFRGGVANAPAEVESGLRKLAPVALIGRSPANDWMGAFAPAGTPPAAVARAEASIVKALQSPTVRERLQSLKLEGSGGSTRLVSAIGGTGPSQGPNSGQLAGASKPETGGRVANAPAGGAVATAPGAGGAPAPAGQSGNRPFADCQREEQADKAGYGAKLNAISRNDTNRLLRGTIVAIDHLLKNVYSKCNDARTKEYVASLEKSRAGALQVCRQNSSNDNCLTSPF